MKSKCKKEAYLHVLQLQLPRHVNHADIIKEISIHIDDAVQHWQENGLTEDEAMLRTLVELGEPALVARRYQETMRSSPGRTATLLLGLNSIFFIIGTFLLFFLQVLPSPEQEAFWQFVISHKEKVLISYTAFWLGSGYYLGYRYGFSMKKSLQFLVHTPLLMNYLLMLLVLFRIVPSEWFGNLLSTEFVLILICVITTLALSRIFEVGYQIGIRSISLE